MDILLTKKLAEWLRKYGRMLAISILLVANIYQYLRAIEERTDFKEERRYYQDEINKTNAESLKHERERQEKLDELFRELLRN